MKIKKDDRTADLPESMGKLLVNLRGWEADGTKKKTITKPAIEAAVEEPETVEVEPETSAVDEARREGKILGNQSGLYHTPDSPYYSRTKAEEFFETTEEAEAAGYLHWDRRIRDES